MLGRQQIAGVPTAIHELFKNAHDAYAGHVRVDYIHALNLFVLRDDGLGMTRSDFEARWLTLGTESKVGANDPGRIVWTGPEDLPRRASLGEKGIGRLAVAVIGPQVLVYSRAIREDGLTRPILGFVNWSLFEQPGLDLDRIEVPVVEMEPGHVPDWDDVKHIVKIAERNVETLSDVISTEQMRRIRSELEDFEVDIGKLYGQIGTTDLDARPYGTHFLVKPCNPELELDLALGTLFRDQEATPLERYLLGFGNTMFGAGKAPPITAEFWEHRHDGSSSNLIGPLEFFTPDEFASADQHVEGSFDAYGKFVGRVRIYDVVEHGYVVAPPEGISGSLGCGPFSLSFATVQGTQRDTRMPPTEWEALRRKCNKIGGLYIYRDGVRVLPYGNSDYDWLNIEKRRTLAAKDWYFSYRRIFGAVEISHRFNGGLVEKAGREGFRQNKAYRQFQQLIENLFQRLAADFFRDDSVLSSDWSEIRAQKQRDYEIEQKREKQVRAARKQLDDNLAAFFLRLRERSIETACEKLEGFYSEKLARAERTEDPFAAGEIVFEVEAALRREFQRLEASLSVSRPRTVGLTKRQKQDWEAYTGQRKKIIETVVEPMRDRLQLRIRELRDSGRAETEPRRLLVEPVQQESDLIRSSVDTARKQAQTSFQDFDKSVRAAMQQSWASLSSVVEEVKADLARTEVAKLTPGDIERRRDNLIARIRETGEGASRMFQGLSEQFKSIIDGLEAGIVPGDAEGMLENRNEDLQAQNEQFSDLAQAGMALGIVQHEFSSQVRNINQGLDALKPWADRNTGLETLYSRLRISFEHLESYLQLFVPLNRRLQRHRVEVSGLDIEEFLRTVFELRLERHKVKLVVTPRFRERVVKTYPSTVMPVFVNLLDNAIYWLGTGDQPESVIQLDANDTGYSVMNNGPGVDPRIAERIFDFGETTKPNGRGMGLYISREALKKEGMDLVLEQDGLNVPPRFLVLAKPSEPYGNQQ